MTNSMNLEMSEVFLLVWAVLATVAAGYFQYRLKRAMLGGIVLCAVLSALGDGKAQLIKKNGRLVADMGEHEVTLTEVSR
jgi:hypothetical protein